MTTLRDYIIDILKDVYYNNDQADPFEPEYADLIIDLYVKLIDGMADKFLDLFPIEIEEVESMQGRLVDELPGEVAYMKALLDIKNLVKSK